MSNIERIAIVVIGIIFALHELLHFVPTFSDEMIYVRMSKAFAEGLVPYKDFFFAHPPIQLFVLAFPSRFDIKVVYTSVAVLSYLTAVMVYVISEKIFRNEKTAFFSYLLFILSPAFLIFYRLDLGMFISMLFILISFYYFVERRFSVSSLFFVISVYTRYLSVLMISMFILYEAFCKKNIRNAIKFVFLSVFFSLLFLSISFSMFGGLYIEDTFLYHLESNIRTRIGIAEWVDQYLNIGFFIIFLSLLGVSYYFFRKDCYVLVASIVTIFHHLTVLTVMRQVTFHYFLHPLPFTFIIVSRILSSLKTRDDWLKIGVPVIIIIILSIYSNLENIEYYFSDNYADSFYDIVSYVENISSYSELDKYCVFGEPRIMNYISYVYGIPVWGGFFDSDMKFIRFYGSDKIIEMLIKNPPDFLIVDYNYKNYYSRLLSNVSYIRIGEWNHPGYYHVMAYVLNTSVSK